MAVISGSKQPLGTGSFGSVYAVSILSKSGGVVHRVAVKTLNPNLAEVQRNEAIKLLEKERQILRVLQRDPPAPHTVKCLEPDDSGPSERSSSPLIMEMAPGATLDTTSRWPLKDALALAYQVLEAIDAWSQKGVVHLDLKPENIVYCPQTKRTTVIDFGMGEQFSPDDQSGKITRCSGSPYYVAPEVMKKENVKKADIWSLGSLLMVLAIGMDQVEETFSRYPGPHSRNRLLWNWEISNRLQDAFTLLPKCETLSSYVNIVNAMLQIDLKIRQSAKDLLRYFSPPPPSPALISTHNDGGEISENIHGSSQEVSVLSTEEMERISEVLEKKTEPYLKSGVFLMLLALIGLSSFWLLPALASSLVLLFSLIFLIFGAYFCCESSPLLRKG